MSCSDYAYILSNSPPQLLQIQCIGLSWYIPPYLFWSPLMLNVDEIQWKTYSADPKFQRYLGTCKDFDPVGIERALQADEILGSFDFRNVIVGAYLEDCASGTTPRFKCATALSADQTGRANE